MIDVNINILVVLIKKIHIYPVSYSESEYTFHDMSIFFLIQGCLVCSNFFNLMGKLKIYFTPQKPNHFSFI